MVKSSSLSKRLKPSKGSAVTTPRTRSGKSHAGKDVVPPERDVPPAGGDASAAAAGDAEHRILVAARREFIAKGLAGTRMQAIAEGAGVNKALLHYYYRSKEKLYQTVLEDILRSVWGRVQSEFRTQGRAEGLEALVQLLVGTYIRTLAANPDFPLFVFREIADGGHVFQASVKEFLKTFEEIPMGISKALKAEAKAGRIKPVDPIQFALNLMGMCVATFIALPMMKKINPELGIKADFGTKFLEDRIRNITDTLFNGIRMKKPHAN